MRPLSLILLLSCVFALASTAYAREIELKEGDCWSYNTRPGEESSFIVIRKIEHFPKAGEIVHISIYGVKLKNPAIGGFSDSIGHMPIAGDNLRKSLKQKLDRKPPDSDWEPGYRSWLKAKGGVYALPVRDCVKSVEIMLGGRRGKS